VTPIVTPTRQQIAPGTEPGAEEGEAVTPVEQLSHIIPALEAVVDNIWYGQLDGPTPCAEFTVHDVLDHMIVGGATFAPLLRGEMPPAVTAPAVYGWVPAAEFRSTMDDLLAAAQSPNALERVVESPFGAVSGEVFASFVAFDGLIHGWDLARATGQRWTPSDEVVTAVDAFARMALGPEMREGGAFAHPTTAPAGADRLDQLAAFSGRTV
jgi:uncharacterized protein (TIGR03086 family)